MYIQCEHASCALVLVDGDGVRLLHSQQVTDGLVLVLLRIAVTHLHRNISTVMQLHNNNV